LLVRKVNVRTVELSVVDFRNPHPGDSAAERVCGRVQL